VRASICAVAALILADAAGDTVFAAGSVGPQSDAATLRAARGAGMGAELRLEFELRHDSEVPSALTLAIGSDYLDLIEHGRETIYDFRLRRRLVLDRAARTFTSIALYSDIAFRRFDMEKRAMLAEMMRRATAGEGQMLGLKPFWIESEVGVSSGVSPRPLLEHERLADGAYRFRFEGEEVAYVAPMAERLSLRDGQAFARFLRHRLALHPDIVAAIEEDGRMPRRLVFVTMNGEDRHVAGLVLRRAERREGDYPLPAAARSLPLPATADDPESASLRRLLPSMLEAVASGREPRALGDYRQAVDHALKRHDGFAAALLLAEMTLQYGREANDCTPAADLPCRTPEDLSRALGGDARAAALYRAQALGGKDGSEALAIWRGLSRESEPEAYIIDLFIANLESAANHREAAIAAFEKVLRGNPALGVIYKDLGDHYLRVGRVDLAWICYDLGRSLRGRTEASSLRVVDALERSLAAQYPDFF
jgi:tetratricopeptide (TPR) repeat protein